MSYHITGDLWCVPQQVNEEFDRAINAYRGAGWNVLSYKLANPDALNCTLCLPTTFGLDMYVEEKPGYDKDQALRAFQDSAGGSVLDSWSNWASEVKEDIVDPSAKTLKDNLPSAPAFGLFAGVSVGLVVVLALVLIVVRLG